MKINKTIEREDGSVVFQGELSPPEVAFVIEVGLNELHRNGALPFLSAKTVNQVDVYPLSDIEQ